MARGELAARSAISGENSHGGGEGNDEFILTKA